MFGLTPSKTMMIENENELLKKKLLCSIQAESFYCRMK